MTTANDSAVWHLVGYFDDPFAGAELELLAIADLIATRRRVELWSVVAPHSSFGHRGVKHIQPFARQFPHAGVLVWGGAHVPPAPAEVPVAEQEEPAPEPSRPWGRTISTAISTT